MFLCLMCWKGLVVYRDCWSVHFSDHGSQVSERLDAVGWTLERQEGPGAGCWRDQGLQASCRRDQGACGSGTERPQVWTCYQRDLYAYVCVPVVPGRQNDPGASCWITWVSKATCWEMHSIYMCVRVPEREEVWVPVVGVRLQASGTSMCMCQ